MDTNRIKSGEHLLYSLNKEKYLEHDLSVKRLLRVDSKPFSPFQKTTLPKNSDLLSSPIKNNTSVFDASNKSQENLKKARKPETPDIEEALSVEVHKYLRKLAKTQAFSSDTSEEGPTDNFISDSSDDVSTLAPDHPHTLARAKKAIKKVVNKREEKILEKKHEIEVEKKKQKVIRCARVLSIRSSLPPRVALMFAPAQKEST